MHSTLETGLEQYHAFNMFQWDRSRSQSVQGFYNPKMVCLNLCGLRSQSSVLSCCYMTFVTKKTTGNEPDPTPYDFIGQLRIPRDACRSAGLLK